MSIPADKTQQNKTQAFANIPVQKQNSSSPGSKFVDNGPDATAQAKFRDGLNNSPHVQQLKAFREIANNSPHVQQLKAFGELANNSPHLQQLKAFGELANNNLRVKTNNTGLPYHLKSGAENLSGFSLDDVKVHNSNMPAQLKAHAYAHGTDIHLASAQETHLPHEAWHVVQQKQGMVKSTLQMKGNVNVNDDTTLEKEADVMGAKALSSIDNNKLSTHQTPSPSASGNLHQYKIMPSQPNQIIQRHDKHNSDRLTAAGRESDAFVDESIAGEVEELEGVEKTNYIKKAKEMQMDHGISQDNLNSLDDSITVISTLVNPGTTKYTKLKAAYQALVTEIEAFDEKDNHDTIGGFLLNIRKNLTPGFRNTTGNPGSTFDAEVTEADGTVSQAVNTPQLLNIDNQLRLVGRLVGKLPNQQQGTQVKYYNPNLESTITDAITSIASSLDSVNTHGAPAKFDKDLWYRHKGKWVKKAPAEYLDAVPDALDEGAEKNSWKIPMLNVSYYWQIEVKSYEIKDDKRDKSATGADLAKGITYGDSFNIQVSVEVPQKSWVHIYERHTLENFKGQIEAVNTFWKEPPIDKVNMTLLKPEVSLLIDRFVDVNDLEGIEDGETWPINGVANKMFFQGRIDLDKSDKKRPKLEVTLTSIAPQSPDLAVAILPAILQAHKDKPPVVAE